MDFDRLNKWLTLVANFGVVAGIFFLAIEVRQNQEILEFDQQLAILNARATDVQQFQSIRLAKVESEDVTEIWLKGFAGQELSPTKQEQFDSMCGYQIWADAAMYERSVVLGSEANAQATVEDAKTFLKRSGVYERCWKQNRGGLARYGYKAYVDAVERRN